MSARNDDDDVAALAALRRRLHSDAEMERFLTALVGPDNWVRDDSADVWVMLDDRHDGPGRGFIVMQRGGDWFRVVVPDAEVS